MRVLLQSRKSLFSVPGGDTVQVLKTAEALRARGVQCEVSTELRPDLKTWDLVHLFNLIRPQEIYCQASNASAQGKPVALSTIYLSGLDYDRLSRRGIVGFASRVLTPDQFEYAKVLGRAVVNGERHEGTSLLFRYGYRRLQKRIVDFTSIFLPNSVSEFQRVVRDFPLALTKPNVVVPNAVDLSLFGGPSPGIKPEIEALRGCVLCVARIEERKNQLRLVRAMRGLNWPLVLIGQPSPNSQNYFAQVLHEAEKGKVHFVGQIDHEALRPYYDVARVHVLASWMETTGLSSLEAALVGCNLVITDMGDTKEYFGEDAFYCQPDSEESLRAAIVAAYSAPPPVRLQERIKAQFGWHRAADKTIEAYEMVRSRQS